jgi:hypothetical protein
MEAENEKPFFNVSEEVGLRALGIGNDIPAEMARIEVQKIRSHEERAEALKSLSEQYPAYFDKLRAEKERRSMMFNKRAMKLIWVVVFILIVWLLTSCNSTLATNYKVTKGTDTYYTECIYLDYGNDSIYFVELKRNGEIKRNCALKISEVVIKEKK